MQPRPSTKTFRTCDELVAELDEQNRDLLFRAEVASAQLSDEQLNESPDYGWSPAQIFEHMVLANSYYLKAIEAALRKAPSGGEAPTKFSWFGRTVYRMSGPGGNAPAPRKLHPGPGPFGREVYGRWKASQEEVIALLERAKGKNLGKQRFRNPFLKLFKMTLCDFFAILTTHTERHVRQIEGFVRPA
jgi:hypothetical protein